MSVPFPSLCGPTYYLDNKLAAIERCINFYPTVNENQGETKYDYLLEECPGNAPFGQLPVPSPLNVPSRGVLDCDSFGLYGVNGPYLWHMNQSGVYDFQVMLPGTGAHLNPVSLSKTGTNQLFISDDSLGFSFQLDSLTLTSISTSDYVSGGHSCFQDGYILAVSRPVVSGVSPNFFQISGNSVTPVGDSRLWDPANRSFQQGQADPLKTIKSSREYIRLWGSKRSQAYYNAGASGFGGFPFQTYNDTFIESGIEAEWTADDLGDSFIWIGQDARGTRAAWRDFGFQPQRVSTFAVEQAWAGYSVRSDAISFPLIWKGHLWWQVTFPTAGHTWLYDATVSHLTGKNIWFERTFQTNTGVEIQRPELFHAFSYGKHLVASGGADGNPGAIYQYADSFSDCTVSQLGDQMMTAIIPHRIVPHIYDLQNRGIVNRVELNAIRPLLMRVSRIGGTPSGTVYTMQQNVNEPQMTYKNGLGKGRDWVFEFYGDGTINRNGIVTGSIAYTPLSA